MIAEGIRIGYPRPHIESLPARVMPGS